MLFLIEKDSATKIPKEGTIEEARAFVDQGFTVHRIGDGGELLPLEDVETAPAAAPKKTSAKPAAKKKA